MKSTLVFLLLLFLSCTTTRKTSVQTENINTILVPAFIKGNFADDYDIRYTINDSLFTQHPNINYHIVSCDTLEQFILARNDAKNPGEPRLYTRIDFMRFSGMEPYRWGFCLTTYNATTVEEARSRAKADRANPKKGCGGYPFSRMQRVN